MDGGNDSPFVRITNREIYDGLREVQKQMEKLENNMNLIMKDNIEIRREYGGRIRSLELRFYGVLAGLIAALTSLGVGLGVGGL